MPIVAAVPTIPTIPTVLPTPSIIGEEQRCDVEDLDWLFSFQPSIEPKINLQNILQNGVKSDSEDEDADNLSTASSESSDSFTASSESDDSSSESDDSSSDSEDEKVTLESSDNSASNDSASEDNRKHNGGN